jgi:hypothetical protein
VRELSLHILDIISNSIEAEASRVLLVIEELKSQNLLRIRIRDNGRGMSDDFLAKVLDPFVTSRSTRSVGMGLSLYKHASEQAGGKFHLESKLGVGTQVTAEFQLNNYNRAPLGDISNTIVNLIVGALDVHFLYLHKTDLAWFSFDSYWMFSQMDKRECLIYDLVGPAVSRINQRLKQIVSYA